MPAPSTKGTATTTLDGDGGATSTVSRPTAGGTVTTGDVYLVWVIHYDFGGSSASAASITGFTQLATAAVSQAGDQVRGTLLAKAHDGSEGASFTVTTPNSDYTYIAADIITGADVSGTGLANFLDVAAATATTGSLATPAVTTTDVDRLAWTGIGSFGITTVSASPSVWDTQRANLDGGFFACATKTQATAGSTGTNSWTGSGTDQNVRITIAIKPPAGGGSTVNGTAVAAFGSLTATATGVRAATGVVSQALGALTATATGTRTATGAVSFSLGALTSTAAGLRTVTATAAGSFGALTGTATGTRDTAGTAAANLGGLTATATGTRTTAGTAAGNLGALTATVAGEVTVVASAAANLGGLSATATDGQFGVIGTGTAALGALTATASGQVDHLGAGIATFGALTSSATGQRTIVATAAANLGGITATILAVRTVTGIASTTFGGLTATVIIGSAIDWNLPPHTTGRPPAILTGHQPDIITGHQPRPALTGSRT